MKGDYQNEIYLGTILLEKNRWAKVREPSLLISNWTKMVHEEGFDGLELWQNHALEASKEEIEKLINAETPIKIFNSYDKCENETSECRARTAALVHQFSSAGMKYNFGKESLRHEEYCRNVEKWRTQLPSKFRFLCECHGGTTVQEPQFAKETFAQLQLPDYEIIIHGMGGEDKNVKALFELHGAHITHIHANISHKTQMEEEDVLRRVALLKELGFSGSFTIEFTEGIGVEKEDAMVNFKNATRDMKLIKKCLEKA